MAFPGSYSFNYYKGDTFEFVLRPKNSDGSAFDLDGYSANFFIANTRGDNPTFSLEAQAVVDDTTNIVTCTILPGAGGQLDAGTYVYDVEVENGASLVFTLVTGTVTVTEQISGAA